MRSTVIETTGDRGTLLAARFSFMPNRLGLCGPDGRTLLLDYLAAGRADAGLEQALRAFHGAYPYLHFIAHATGIGDPFDPRVVEAYWVGNDLLRAVPLREFHTHLRDRFERRFPRALLASLLAHVPEGAHAHHNFHVLAMPIRTGAHDVPHTLETMDACRISWGRVLAATGDDLMVERRPLVLERDRLALGTAQVTTARWRFLGTAWCRPQAGDVVAIHWGCACHVLSAPQARALARETTRHLALANRLRANVVLR